MPGFSEYEDYDVVGLAALVAVGDVTASELMEAAIARCEARNPALNAVVQKLYEMGRDFAGVELPKSPIAGVPY
ncbi:MAG: amidase, partial [Alphaproteobacteria bacterium]